MILVDANVLLYAANRAAPEHKAARTWLDARLGSTARVGLPWPSLLAFVRIATNPTVLRHPVTPKQAWQQVEEWLTADTAWVPTPGPRHADILGPLLAQPFVTSRMVPDAHLAALAIEHGLTLCSTDGDFGRFRGLAWQNPLQASTPQP